MLTPEEFEWSLHQSMDHQMDDWKDRDEVHALIRARDAEITELVRAETLAQVNAIAQQSALTATDVRVVVDHLERMAGLRWETPVQAIGAGARAPLGAPRRLVGPWEPDPRTPEQASNEALDELRRRLTGDKP